MWILSLENFRNRQYLYKFWEKIKEFREFIFVILIYTNFYTSKQSKIDNFGLSKPCISVYLEKPRICNYHIIKTLKYRYYFFHFFFILGKDQEAIFNISLFLIKCESYSYFYLRGPLVLRLTTLDWENNTPWKGYQVTMTWIE